MTNNKIVSLDGKEIRHKEPNQDVINVLEKALAEARSGEVQQVVIVKSFFDECIGHSCEGPIVHKWGMYGAICDAAETYRDIFIANND
ncbi:MAG: hypothetical protein ACRBBW_13115 [Cellvibrionaceae bacterium]